MDDDNSLTLAFPALSPSSTTEKHDERSSEDSRQQQQEDFHYPTQPQPLQKSPIPSHVRPHGAAQHAKRLTLNFPINPPTLPAPDRSTPPSASTRPSRQSSFSRHPSHVPGTAIADEHDDGGYDILTAIASQERKVLELREELQRAETELATLKKQWALSERSRKTTEVNHHAEPLLALRSPASRASGEFDNAFDTPPSAVQARLSRELDRRNSLRTAATAGTMISPNGRRVFRGSHTRTLSLLAQPIAGTGSGMSGSERGIPRTPRSATLPSIDRDRRENNARFQAGTYDSKKHEDVLTSLRKSVPPPSREMLMRTGKQMASDLREGLWTFLEDIRQATVGEEGVSATESRTVPPSSHPSSSTSKRDSTSAPRSRDRLSSVQADSASRSSSSSRRKEAETANSGKDSKSSSMDIGASFWSEFGIDAPGQGYSTTSKVVSTTKMAEPSNTNTQNEPSGQQGMSLLDLDDNWDGWDAAQPQQQPQSESRNLHTPSSSRSTLESKQDQSPQTQTSSPRTSASFGDHNQATSDSVLDRSLLEGIPWTSLTKFTPSKLTQTASNFMAEWERSLSPAVDNRSRSRSPLAAKQD